MKQRTDLLVIGGGVAGLMAAIAGRQAGVSVILVSRGPAGRSGNSAVSGCMFNCAIAADDSPEQHFEDTMRGGKQVNNRAMVQTMVEQMPARLQELLDWGLPLQKRGDELILRRSGGHQRFRQLVPDYQNVPFHTRGLALTTRLADVARDLGVQFISPAVAISLLKDPQGIVAGALCLDQEAKAELRIEAGAVVLAAGGGGSLFQFTDNTRDVTGASFSLALAVGAALRDMEYVQFHPCVIPASRMLVTGDIFGDGAVLRNNGHKEFMDRYDPAAGHMTTRDNMCQAIFQELWLEGDPRGHVWLDASPLGDLAESKYPHLYRMLLMSGINMRKDYIPVAPSVHFLMGGVRTNARTETGVPGLYAAGEAAGGLHGANRLSGNAIAEGLVFGHIAGQTAAHFAAKRAADLENAEPAPWLWANGHVRPDVAELDEMKVTLRQVMWTQAGILRSGTGLATGLTWLRGVRRELLRLAPRTYEERLKIYELEGMLAGAMAITLSAQERRESRGSHWRQDYPDAKPDQAKRPITVYRAGTRLMLSR